MLIPGELLVEMAALECTSVDGVFGVEEHSGYNETVGRLLGAVEGLELGDDSGCQGVGLFDLKEKSSCSTHGF